MVIISFLKNEIQDLERIDGPGSSYGYKWRHYNAEVYKGYDTKTDSYVVIKKVSCNYDYPDSFEQVKTERCCRLAIGTHRNLLRTRDIKDMHHTVYFAYEYMECSLEKMMKPSCSPLSPSLRKEYLKQILTGVEYIHGSAVVHRHLEPRFLLIDLDENVVKISEFGECKGVKCVDELHSRLVDHNFGYRAPEVIYGPRFSYAADVWAVGCIFAEMVLHKQLFPGKNPGDELYSIYSLFGRPDGRDWPGIGEAFSLIEQYKSCKEQNLESLTWGCFGIEKTGLDLLKRMLTMEPKDRITAADALKHSYFSESTSDAKMIGIEKKSGRVGLVECSGKRKFPEMSGDDGLESGEGMDVDVE